MAEDLKLIRSEFCPYCLRIVLAVVMKRLQGRVEEEDLSNKSALLLESNPVYKKVPVLIHNGKAIAESLVILEYIDETWPEPPLLPKDPQERANARFFAKFVDEKIVPTADKVLTAKEEEKDGILKELHEQMMFIEKELIRLESVGDGRLGYFDIVVYFIFYEFLLIKQVTGIELIDFDKLPAITQWMGLLGEVSTISMYCLPPEYKYIDSIRARIEAAKSASE
ncbi:glutathione S-transferase U7 [Ricinus communis]|uniref:Glutathione S-transferase n=1 Tax=Ricinus communis TaxID=3988 RepID=B9T6D0_RICCO|nr:glutathione S-transferase U7 [Ricinus communis]EEF28586.1 glutathione s-transferase, putative [Ricinus communis]|eukprot:XP_002533799.1 glutathione S-transferase U7 [Ricinus communis]